MRFPPDPIVRKMAESMRRGKSSGAVDDDAFAPHPDAGTDTLSLSARNA